MIPETIENPNMTFFYYFSFLELSSDSNSNNGGGGLDEEYNNADGNVYSDSSYQCIRFQTFQQSQWHTLCDQNLKELYVSFCCFNCLFVCLLDYV